MPTVQICTCRGVIKKCDECCYNFRQVVQNVRSVVTICDGCTKCDKRYYILCMTKYQNLTSVVIISDRYYKKLKTVITFCDRCVITKSYNCYYNLLQVSISKCKDLLLCFAIGANIAKRKRLQLRFTEGFRALISNHVIIFP